MAPQKPCTSTKATATTTRTGRAGAPRAPLRRRPKGAKRPAAPPHDDAQDDADDDAAEAKRCRRGWSRSSRSSTVQSDILTPPPTTPPALPDVFDSDMELDGVVGLPDEREAKRAARHSVADITLPPLAAQPLPQAPTECGALPAAPEGFAYMHKIRTRFLFAGHLDNRTQWQLLHQAIVTYMVELNMSPLIVFRLDHTGPFRGFAQKHTEIAVITCATWTNAFENDMQDLIRMVWHGGDRQIEVHRLPVAA